MQVTYGAFTCAYLGIIGIPPFSAFFTKDPIIERGLWGTARHRRADRVRAHRVFTPVSALALALVVAGAALAWTMYGRRPVPGTAPAAGFAVAAAHRDLYGDAFNESVLMRPGQWLTRLSVYFDSRGVDGLVNTTAAAVGGSSRRLRRVQNGMVRS